MRPNWDEWGLGLAKAVATRADCSRRQVGAVILDTEHRVVSTGYNGTRPGTPGCLDGSCPRAFSDVVPGSNYDSGPGTCGSCHAEVNAILFADRARLENSTLLCTDEPCYGCAKIIRNTRIRRVVWPEGEYENG